MNLTDIETEINNYFVDTNFRQIVMWYDKDKEFEEFINRFKPINAEVYILEENKYFKTKYDIEHVNKDTNYLIYAPFEQPEDEENYLADIANYAHIFSANKLDILKNQLGIPEEYGEIIKEYPKFWRSEARINKFKELDIDYNKTNIILGILTVLSKQTTMKLDYIVRKVIVDEVSRLKKLNETNNLIETFNKFDVEDDFWHLVYMEYGYQDDNPSVNKLIRSLLLNYTETFFDGKFPQAWIPYLVENKNNPRIFIGELMKFSPDVYDDLSDIMEEKLRVANNIKNHNVDSYINCDTFKIFDKKIISYYISLLNENKHEIDLNPIKSRNKTNFYKYYEDEYQLINWANEFIYLINEFERVILPEDINDLIKLFSEKFVNIDRSYRKFYYHYNKIEDTDDIEELRQLIENMYVNTFLTRLNRDFSEKLNELESIDDIKIDKQWKFYKSHVAPTASRRKVCVIISDAFRYGCAVELAEELEKDPTKTVNIKPMLSTIPSYTDLGMAALLPNNEIIYDEKLDVYNDGKSTRGTENRDKILKSSNPKSLAIQYNELVILKQKELRELVKDADILYIYHNKIDAIGDELKTEKMVCQAAQDTIEDLIKLIKRLIDNVNFSNFLITADHGFIYKFDKLEEQSKVNLDNVDTISRKRRYLITNHETSIDGTICFNLNYLNMSDLYVTVPKIADVFKAPSSGLNYVHGGGSLEECIVPILEVRGKSGAKNQTTVELELISRRHKISNYDVNLILFQKENVSSKVTPLEAYIYFVESKNDGTEEKISNELLIYADKKSEHAQDREFREHLTLKRRKYPKENDYYLLIKDSEGNELSRTRYTIDIAFYDDFDFDF